MKRRFLLDANILIGARQGKRDCALVMAAGEAGQVELVVTPEIAEEARSVPPYVSMVTVRGSAPSAFDAARIAAFIDKEYGGEGGQRREPSEGDRSLLRAAIADRTLYALVSDDRDIEYLWLDAPADLRRRTRLWKAREAAANLAPGGR